MSTPTPPSPYRTPSSSTPTGSWRHPAMDEVTKRNSERAFTDVSFHRLSQNSIALGLSFLVVSLASRNDISAHLPTSPTLKTLALYTLYALRLLFLYNILESLMRLLRPADDFSDLSLTPSQRQLFGLNPNSPLSDNAKATSVVTPPRYTKTPTRSPSFGASMSPTLQRKNAPTPTTPSPLRMGGGRGDRLGASVGSGYGGSPGSSPVKVGGSSVTLGNRWVYEKNIQRKGDGRWSALERSIFSPRPPERSF